MTPAEVRLRASTLYAKAASPWRTHRRRRALLQRAIALEAQARLEALAGRARP